MTDVEILHKILNDALEHFPATSGWSKQRTIKAVENYFKLYR